MEITEPKKLGDLPIGARILVRSKKDWRSAAIAKKEDEKITIVISSPTGYSYRLKRTADTEIFIEGSLSFLEVVDEDWREKFTQYDHRW